MRLRASRTCWPVSRWAAVVLAGILGLLPRPTAADPVTGAWSEILEWPIVAIHTVQLHTGEILVWSSQPEQPHVLELELSDNCDDVSPGSFTQKANPIDIFCAGHTHLDDGTILVNGGHIQNNIGEAETHLFQYDMETDDWNWTPIGEIEDTHSARWYPTLTTLADGRVLNMSGSEKRCSSGPNQDDLCAVHDDCPPANTENCIAQPVPIPELFDPVTRTWAEVPLLEKAVQFYPFNFVGPDGSVFFAGADRGVSTATLDLQPHESATFDVPTGGFAEGDESLTDGGSAVMYEPGRILKSGGSAAGDNSFVAISDTEIIDLGGAATWSPASSMNIPRRRHNLTMLPDGTVLVTGGTRRANREFDVDRTCGGTDEGDPCSRNSDCPEGVTCQYHPMGEQQWVSEAEIWDPSSDDWTPMAGAQVPRMYHSTAILLPDGRVLSAGGGRGGGAARDYANAEIFCPPYLYTDTPRPVIYQAPEIIHYGEVFEVRSPEAGDVDRVSLVRLAAVTHSFDQNRRFVPLAFTQSNDNELEIDAPVEPADAPPGYYMLFLVSEEGVPSIARFVRLLHANPGADALYEYSAKIVCGVPEQSDGSRHAPGTYSTSINIHNPGAPEARFYKKVALTYPPGDQRPGEVLPLGRDALGYDEALQTDCRELRRRIKSTDEAPFLEGYLVIQSQERLDVTGVYSTAAVGANDQPTTHSSIDVERIAERARHLDLEVTKRADHFCLPINDVFFYCFALYEVGVENRGPNDAHDIVIEDEATREEGLLAIVPGIFDVEPAGMAQIQTPTGETVSITATIPELLAGDSGYFRFWVVALLYRPPVPVVDPAELELLGPFLPTLLVNRATASAAEPDRWTGNNTADAVTHLP